MHPTAPTRGAPGTGDRTRPDPTPSRRRDDGAPEGPVGVRARAAARGRRLTSRGSHLWPTLILAGWTTLVWARPVLDDFATERLSNPGDSESFAFYLSWNVHALTNGVNPFFTPNMYAPDGLDLGNAISLPAVSLLVSPVSAIFGGSAGYNLALLLAVLFSGLAVYLLAREMFGSVAGATLAGALAVVSPYLTGHGLGHLNLMWVFGFPLLAYLVLRFVRGRLGRWWLAVLVAVTAAFTAGASTELFVTETVFAVIALAVALVFATPDLRSRLLAAVPWLAAGGVGAVVLASPVILAGLSAGIPETAGNAPAAYPTDLTNVVAPTPVIAVGDSFFRNLHATWLGNDAENTAYLPATLLILIAAALFVSRTRTTAGLGAFAAVAFVLSLGPSLTIAGVQTLPMPWKLATYVPGLDHALPGRFSAFVFMALALIVAQVWASGVLHRWFVGGMTAVSLVLLVPNLAAMSFPVDASLPGYVTSGRMADQVSGENVLILPAGQWGPGMRWMDALDFSFTMPTGNGGGAQPPPALGTPLGWALFSADSTYDYDDELLPYLEEHDVDTVVVDGGHREWKRIMDRILPGVAETEDGAWVYRIP